MNLFRAARQGRTLRHGSTYMSARPPLPSVPLRLGRASPKLGAMQGAAVGSRGVVLARLAGVFVRRVVAVSGLLLATSCDDDLAETVPTSVCASGKRWAGKFTPDEEMFPGQDCVECHLSFDGPPLMAAGTVYGLPDRDGTRTSRPLCYGVEGVLVTITGAEGTVLQTRTNRAGNFYFEGQPDELPVPFSVQLDFTLPNGRPTTQTMTTQPSYGGCGRCHDPNVSAATATPDLMPGGIAGPDDVIDADFPIFTGPLHQ
jgi:hypothetical protein